MGAAVVAFLCLLFLFGCGGGAPKAAIVTPPPPPPPPLPAGAANFGMQCGLAANDCPNFTWPSTSVTPGCIRLHDAGTFWSILNPASGTYDWTNLDNWLDVIAQHEPRCVIQVFAWVPCWNASVCTAPPIATNPPGTSAVPADLTASSGSASFNNFVTAFVQHCSPAGNCVKNIIKYYEMWNEWNTALRWTGTAAQLYAMVAPAVPIIRSNVSNSVILTPSIAGGDAANLTTWLNVELTNNSGKPLSDWVAWHDYLANAGTGVVNTPEIEWSSGGNAANLLAAQLSLPAWVNVPWADTETNFDTLTFACAATFSADDCTGQIVRWQLLHDSFGSASLNWYKWNQTIGANAPNPNYFTVYSNMMTFLTGGKFAGPCSSADGITWICDFTEKSGTIARFVWTTNEAAGLTYSLPSGSGYVDYKDFLSGNATSVTGATVPISTIPIMLEE